MSSRKYKLIKTSVLFSQGYFRRSVLLSRFENYSPYTKFSTKCAQFSLTWTQYLPIVSFCFLILSLWSEVIVNSAYCEEHEDRTKLEASHIELNATHKSVQHTVCELCERDASKRFTFLHLIPLGVKIAVSLHVFLEAVVCDELCKRINMNRAWSHASVSTITRNVCLLRQFANHFQSHFSFCHNQAGT
jgi:hypothetical protein